MKVVLVEDHQNLREVLTEILIDEGFEVISLESAEDLDDEPDTHSADTFILDVNLPDESGFSLAKRLKASRPDIYVIIISARTQTKDKVTGYLSGADVYLTKPVDPPELITLLRVRESKKNPQSDSLCLDLKKQELFNEEQSVTLTRLETQVLSALAKANRNFLEHWQLMEHFGAPEADMGIATLQMRISRLRKKIQKIIPQDELISSERGLGYRLAFPIKII